MIHHELRAIGQLADEGIGLNERDVQWVGEKDWIFGTEFSTPSGLADSETAQLVFDGLDTVTTVTLNDEVILHCDNFFLPQRVDVTGKLQHNGKLNKLELCFDSAARVARERENEHGASFSGLRQTSRLHLRKAQYHWGWDWGPSMITCGPYKDIRLETFSVRIADVHVDVDLSATNSRASLKVQTELAGVTERALCSVRIQSLSDPQDVVLEQVVPLDDFASQCECNVELDNPKIWWPRGHGDQPLYLAEVSVKDAAGLYIADTRSVTFGVRRVELIQETLESDAGKSFYFRINGRPIFCVGTNWIPCKSMPTEVTPELYRQWIDLAVENNNNMIRIWGGGYYENNEFYEYCDEKGIMLWHDHMFACGFYPNRNAFHDSVTEELNAQVKRLRNHPSIVLWCGDNEFYMMADRQNIPYDPTETKDFEVFPERFLYFKTIPSVLSKLTPRIPYWPSSPFGGDPANGGKEGDIHQWDVWHGAQLHYQEFPRLGGRFVSEYGMHGFPDIRTVRHFAPEENDRFFNSRIIDCHNKSTGAETKLAKYLFSNFRTNPYDLEAYIYTSQLMQSEALTYANRNWRRGWKGKGKEECSGVLIWQLNDIYPVTSWALVDSFFRKKPAYFTSTRDFSPICVGIDRDPVWRFVDENERTTNDRDEPTFDVFISNLNIKPRRVQLRLRMWDINLNQEVDLGKSSVLTFTLEANLTTELLRVVPPASTSSPALTILAAYVFDPDTRAELSRHFSWPEPYRYLQMWPDAHAKGIPARDETSVSLVCGDYPIKGALAYIDWQDGEDAEWGDNMYDLLPGDRISLPVKGLNGRDVKVRWLHSWEIGTGQVR